MRVSESESESERKKANQYNSLNIFLVTIYGFLETNNRIVKKKIGSKTIFTIILCNTHTHTNTSIKLVTKETLIQ